jgi:hypothetical protein
MKRKEWLALIHIGRTKLKLLHGIHTVRDNPSRFHTIEKLRTEQFKAQSLIEHRAGFSERGSWWCLGQEMLLSARVEKVLRIRRGWARIDGSFILPEKIARTEAAVRIRRIQPALLERLADFKHMSESYRTSVAKGACAKRLPLPT